MRGKIMYGRLFYPCPRCETNQVKERGMVCMGCSSGKTEMKAPWGLIIPFLVITSFVGYGFYLLVREI